MESLQQVWDTVCSIVKQKISTVAFNSWIGIIKPIFLEEDRLYLSVPSTFQKNIIETNYLKLIESTCEEVMGFKLRAVLRSEQGEPEGGSVKNALDSQYTFENFVVAASNKFAFAAAQAVAKAPGRTYNPLLIYGESGLGKTHLLTAIKNTVSENYPSYNIVAIQGEDFINDFIESITHNSQPDFRKKYRSCDVLLVDDIQFIANKTAVQDEFYSTFDNLHRAGKQIVLSSDRPPKDILSLDSRLRSRLELGLADIGAPDYETRVAIIRKKAELASLELSDDVVDYIADKIKVNIRQIQAVITKLSAKYIMNGQIPTLLLTIETCHDIISDISRPAITVDIIKEEVSRVYQIPPEDISSEKQSAQISLVRQISMYVTRELTGLSLKEIGAEFGDRHYSTVNYAIARTAKEIRKNQKLSETIEDIIKNIKSKQ